MRRIKTLTMSSGFLVLICQKGSFRVAENALPPDASIAFGEFDRGGDLVLTIESESFDPVPIGTEPPALPAPMFRTFH